MGALNWVGVGPWYSPGSVFVLGECFKFTVRVQFQIQTSARVWLLEQSQIID